MEARPRIIRMFPGFRDHPTTRGRPPVTPYRNWFHGRRTQHRNPISTELSRIVLTQFTFTESIGEYRTGLKPAPRGTMDRWFPMKYDDEAISGFGHGHAWNRDYFAALAMTGLGLCTNNGRPRITRSRSQPPSCNARSEIPRFAGKQSQHLEMRVIQVVRL